MTGRKSDDERCACYRELCGDEPEEDRKSDVWEWALIMWPVTIIGAAGFAWLAVEVLKWWGTLS
jgi:hypothetical protein